ncbi:MAG: hypothetical protein R2706_19215 [Acidimicrobiales bacterium]
MFDIRKWTFGAWIAMLGLAATIIGGTWWMAQAIVDGDSIAVATRLSITGLCGTYYVLLFQAFGINRRRYG